MDACKIQGLNSYFAKFKDGFDRCVKIQGRNWGISLFSCSVISRLTFADSVFVYQNKKSLFLNTIKYRKCFLKKLFKINSHVKQFLVYFRFSFLF